MTTTRKPIAPVRTLRIFADLGVARAAALQRPPLTEPVLPESLRASIEALWGEPLTAAQHVARIIDAVAREGDAAVSRLSQRFDGSSYGAIEVSSDEVA